MIKLGFDHILVRPNQKYQDISVKDFKERGNPKVHWEAAKEAIPIQISVKYNIPLVIYAEHGESEYGGRVTNEDAKKIKIIQRLLNTLSVMMHKN